MRWAESVNLLDEKLSGLVGDTLIAAASVAYIGPFTATYRKELVSSWIDPTMVHMAYKEEEEKAKVAIKKLDAILMDAGVMCFLELILHAYQ